VVAFSLTPVFALFLLACAVFGLGTGLFGPPRATVLTRAYPENDGAAFGLVLAAGSIGAAALPVAASLLVDYIGRLLVRGMRFTLFRQLHGGTETVEDWRDHLAQSARRLHKVFLLELLTILAALVGLSLLIVVGLYVLYIAGPISHYVIARDEPLVAGIKKGVALAHRHPGELVPRFLIKIAWRFFALAVVAGGLTAIWYYKTMYLPLASLLVGVGFFAIRPFILHFGLMRSEALLSTLQQLDGELQLAEE
ncbi:MAG: hypothetical protein ABEN55_02265, partial [Bradymonadaceae bacterium]